MSKKYFIVSDTHSFYTPLIEALDTAGYNKNNEDHILIVNGDLFDRGLETVELYEFIKSIPKSRRILIKGNHESLYLDLLRKPFPENYDFSNGTVKTFCHVAGVDPKLMTSTYWQIEKYLGKDEIDVEDSIIKVWCDEIIPKVKKSAITKFIKSKEWVDYYELDKYIITHSFIPLQVKNIPETEWIRRYPIYNVHNNAYLEPIPNWRTDTVEYQWEEARWGCPWEFYKDGLFDEEINRDKVLICGHWHASDFHRHFENILTEYDNTDIFYSDNLIAIDACTVLCKRVNVLVIEDGICYGGYGNKLESKCKIETKKIPIIETVSVEE